MDLSEHLVISCAGSAAILAGAAGWESAAAFSAFGIFIDLDHIPDYWRETGLNSDLPRFMNYHHSRSVKKLFLVLHGWELPSLLALAALAWPARPDWFFWGLAGWFSHLALDHRYNRLHKLAYFFAFRLKHGFKAEAFYLD